MTHPPDSSAEASRTRRAPRRARAGVLITALGALALALAACGSSAASAGTSAASKGSAGASGSSTTKSATAFRTCLAQHGVTLPSRPPGGFPRSGAAGSSAPGTSGSSTPASGTSGSSTPGPGTSGGNGGGFFGRGSSQNPAFAKAFAACKNLAPAGGFGGRTFTPTAAQKAALVSYEACMTKQGVQIAANASFATIRSLLASDPAAATANKVCGSILNKAFPRRPGPPPSSTTPASS